MNNFFLIKKLFLLLKFQVIIFIFCCSISIPTICEPIKHSLDQSSINKQFFIPLQIILIKDENFFSTENKIPSINLEGYLIIEEHPINRKTSLRVWVIKTIDNKLIPVKPTVNFLSLIQKDFVLTNMCKFNGFFVKSRLNPNINYFIVNSIELAQDNIINSTNQNLTK